MSELKIISWNVNGFRKRIKNKEVDSVLEKEPDIVLFQETKTSYEKMDKKFLDKSGYESYFLKGESARTGGLASFTKEKPKIVRRFFIRSSDAIGRASVLNFEDFSLVHLYAPAGTGTKAKLNEKLEYLKNLLSFAENAKDNDIIIAGDFNVAHNEADIADLDTKVTFTAEEREILDKLESFGFVDAFRLFNSEEKQFTSWKNQEARENNEGARLDYFFVSESLKDKVKSCEILSDVAGSKHAPIELIIEL